MQEKGPAVSSDVTYMVLGFFSLFPLEKDKHQWIEMFLSYILKEKTYMIS